MPLPKVVLPEGVVLPKNADEAHQEGWMMEGVFHFAAEHTPHKILERAGNILAHLDFTRRGKDVPEGHYALWYLPNRPNSQPVTG